MATLTKGTTFASGDVVTPAKLNNLVDAATISGIVNADISASAAIADTKLAQITTANKVAQSAVANLTTDLAGKAAASHTHAATDITSGTLSNARTTATSANTANAIVARDASGNFQTNSITASSATSSFGAVKIGIGSGSDTSNTCLGGGNPLSSITTGTNNTCVGFNSQNKTNSGSRNVSVGQESLYNNTSGIKNIAIGTVACNQNTTGSQNVAVGDAALYNNISTSGNTAIGDGTLNYHTTGNNNTALGNLAGAFINNYSNSTCIGYNSSVTGSNQIRLGDSSITAVVSQVGNWSDARDKTDIRNTILGLDFIQKLRPVDFKWDCREDYRPAPPPENASEQEKAAYLESVRLENITHDGTHKRTRYHHGFLAQEIKSVIEQTGTDFGGFQDHTIAGGDAAMTISYLELIAPLIKAVQELADRVAVLESK